MYTVYTVTNNSMLGNNDSVVKGQGGMAWIREQWQCCQGPGRDCAGWGRDRAVRPTGTRHAAHGPAVQRLSAAHHRRLSSDPAVDDCQPGFGVDKNCLAEERKLN